MKSAKCRFRDLRALEIGLLGFALGWFKPFAIVLIELYSIPVGLSS